MPAGPPSGGLPSPDPYSPGPPSFPAPNLARPRSRGPSLVPGRSSGCRRLSRRGSFLLCARGPAAGRATWPFPGKAGRAEGRYRPPSSPGARRPLPGRPLLPGLPRFPASSRSPPWTQHPKLFRAHDFEGRLYPRALPCSGSRLQGLIRAPPTPSAPSSPGLARLEPPRLVEGLRGGVKSPSRRRRGSREGRSPTQDQGSGSQCPQPPTRAGATEGRVGQGCKKGNQGAKRELREETPAAKRGQGQQFLFLLFFPLGVGNESC